MSDQPDSNTIVLAVASIIVALSALSVTISTYFRNRKSEQIKLAKEIMDKIDSDGREAFEMDPAKNWPSIGTEAAKRDFAHKYLVLLGLMVTNIRYFSFLVKHGEINNKAVIGFYCQKVIRALDYLDGEYEWAEGSSQSHLMAAWPGYHDAIPILKEIWEQKESTIDYTYP